MWRIRAGRDPDAAACRALLPDLFPAVGYAPELIVAESASGGLIGAVGVVWTEGGFPLGVAVTPDWRRRGVGRALIEAALEALRGETHLVRTASTVEADGPEAAFLHALGFAESRRFLCYETDAADFARSIAPLAARFRTAAPRIVPMREAPPGGAVELLSGEFSTLPFAVARRLTPGAANGYDLDLSLVALEGSRTVGAMVCTRDGDKVEIDLNVVAPDRRRGATNLAVLEAMARRGREAGVRRFVFSCEPHVRDTRNLARRAGATTLPSRILMARRP